MTTGTGIVLAVTALLAAVEIGFLIRDLSRLPETTMHPVGYARAAIAGLTITGGIVPTALGLPVPVVIGAAAAALIGCVAVVGWALRNLPQMSDQGD